MKKSYLSLSIFIGYLGFTSSLFGQTAGDYRTAANSVSWNSATGWQTWDGSQWTSAIKAPDSTNDVFVQAGHTVSLSADGSCKDLFISTGTTNATTGGDGQVLLGQYTAQVFGKLSCYYGAVDISNGTSGLIVNPSTSVPANAITITSGSTGKISFVGNSRNITNTGAWSANNSGNTNTFAIAINLNTGQTATMQTAIKASSWHIVSGTLDAGTYSISADNGTVGQGNITVGINGTLIAGHSGTGNNVFQRTGTSRAGILTVEGRLIFTGGSPYLQMDSIAFNGIVTYASNSNQTLARAQNSGMAPTIYKHLVLSGAGTKTFPNNISVGGNIDVSPTIGSPLTVNGGGFNLDLKGDYTHIINGSGSIVYSAGNEFDLVLSGDTLQLIEADGFPLIIDDLTINNISVDGVLLNSSATTISIKANLVNNGSLAGDGKLLMNGNVPQSVSGSGIVSHLEINNSAGITIAAGNNKLGLTGLLSLVSGTLTTNGNLVLKSTASDKTAMVGPLPQSGAAINGDVIYERFLSAPMNVSGGRSWRLLTTPLKGNSNNTIFDQWQNGGMVDGSGIELWGPGGTGALGNGLAPGPAFSLRTYNSATNSYTSVTNTKTKPLFDANGNQPFLVFVSGPYGSGNISSGAASTNCDATGTLITGTQVYNFTPTTTGNKYQLIGNPYSCPVDFDKIWMNNSSSNNINRKFWIIDPSISEIGAYVTVTYDNGSYIASVGNQNQFIQNGQAFFVEGNNPNNVSSVIIEEDDKETSAAQTAMFRTNGGNLETFRLQLSRQVNNTNLLVDGAVAVCHENNNSALTDADAIKFNNFNENISFVTNGQKLSIESRPLYDNGDTIKIGLNGLQQANYDLAIKPSNINTQNLSAVLYDHFLNVNFPISLITDTTYSFSVTANPASADDSRFIIVFSAVVPLNLSFLSLAAERKDKGVVINWSVDNEVGYSTYTIERSSDGIDFHPAGSVAASSKTVYEYVDDQLGKQLAYYRIKATTRSRNSVYSNVVRVADMMPLLNTTLHPNPVTGNILYLSAHNIEEGVYAIRIYDVTGVNAYSRYFHCTTTATETPIDITQLLPGIYLLKIETEKGDVISEQKFIRQ